MRVPAYELVDDALGDVVEGEVLGDLGVEGHLHQDVAELLAQVKDEATQLRALLDGAGDLPSIREAYQQLETAAFRIAESLYGSAEGEPATTEG